MLRNFIILASIFCIWPAGAQTSVLVGKAESRAYIDVATADSCTPTIRETYTRHSAIRIFGKRKSDILVRQDFDVGQGCFEGYDPANVSVTANPIDLKTGRVRAAHLWKFSTKGVTGHIEDQRYVVEMPGCCGSAKTLKYFSLQTGEFIGSSTGDVVHIEADNAALRRAISIEGNVASDSMGQSDAAATLYYFDDAHLRQAVSIFSESSRDGCYVLKFYFSGPEEHRKSLHLKERKDFLGVRLVVELGYWSSKPPTVLNIPLSADGIDFEAASVERGENVRLVDATHNISLQRTAANGGR